MPALGRPFAIYLYGAATGPLPIPFEEAAERLAAMGRLHFEWDGSFVWRGTANGAVWQIDGMIYDLGEQIQYVDLKGCCPREHWNELLEVFTAGDPEAISILRLPDRRPLGRNQFEKETWEKSSPPDPLA